MSSDPLNERPWTSPSPFINKSNNNIGSSSYDSRYGNAYENEDIHAAWGADAPPITSMPSPSKYRTPHNVWNESNKTEFEESDASTLLSTHSRTSFAERETSQVKAKKNKRPDEVEKALPEKWDESRLHPSKRRFLLRILQLVAAVGSIGFAAGASPFSGEAMPLGSPAYLYFLYLVAILTILWGLFHIALYVYRLALRGTKLNRIAMTAIDSLLAIMWGVGIILEIATFRCPPGGFNHWCDFYNVSIFWGMLSLLLFATAVACDFYGSCTARRK